MLILIVFAVGQLNAQIESPLMGQTVSRSVVTFEKQVEKDSSKIYLLLNIAYSALEARDYPEAKDSFLTVLQVDSFGARGVDDRAVMERDICTGRRIRGSERAGDLMAVLAEIWERLDVRADRTILMGWSTAAGARWIS